MRATVALLGLLIVGACFPPAFAGDALYGKVVEVKSAELVTLDYGTGQYYIRLVGIDVPEEVAAEAEQLTRKLALGKKAAIRIDRWTGADVVVGRVIVKDADGKLQDVGLELIRNGLALREKDYDYKYGELSAAENEARKAGRGYWKNRR